MTEIFHRHMSNYSTNRSDLFQIFNYLRVAKVKLQGATKYDVHIVAHGQVVYLH